MILWMRRWHIGTSLMGENVSESIHSYIAHVLRTYSGFPNWFDTPNVHSLIADLPLRCILVVIEFLQKVKNLVNSNLFGRKIGSRFFSRYKSLHKFMEVLLIETWCLFCRGSGKQTI